MPRVRAGAAAVAQCALRQGRAARVARRSSRRSPTPRRGSAPAGRLVIRKSGTEPVIRVMAQGEDEELLAGVVDDDLRGDPGGSRGIEDVETPARQPPRRRSDARMTDEGRVLIIAGSDSGGGAGIQADIKTVTMLDAYRRHRDHRADGAEHARACSAMLPIPPEFIRQQIEVVLDDIGADAVKTGMLHDAAVIETVAAVLAERAPAGAARRRSGHGRERRRAADRAGGDRRAEAAAGAARRGADAEPAGSRNPRRTTHRERRRRCVTAAEALLALGCRAVLLKGGHLAGDTVHDVLATATGHRVWAKPADRDPPHPRHRLHAGLGDRRRCWRRPASKAAVERARDYVRRAIASAPGLGRGHGPLDHAHPLRDTD